MPLKYQLDNLDNLSDDVKPFYVEKNGKYVLDVDGVEDASAIKANRDEILNEKKQLKEKFDQLNSDFEKLKSKGAEQSGDFKALYEQMKAKAEDAENKYKQALDTQKEKDRLSIVGDIAKKLSSNSYELLEPVIAKRINIGEDGKPIVLDANGKPTISKVDDLISEIRANKSYAPVIDASAASGGGANGARGNNHQPKVDFEKMKPKDKFKLARENQSK